MLHKIVNVWRAINGRSHSVCPKLQAGLRKRLHTTHTALHVSYLGGVALESHYVYGKIAAGLLIVTLVAHAMGDKPE